MVHDVEIFNEHAQLIQVKGGWHSGEVEVALKKWGSWERLETE